MDQATVSNIIAALEKEYPDSLCSLQYDKDYELLFAVRLSAQCTDERVNKVTPALYTAFPTLEAFADATPEAVEPYIRSCGFFHGKARDLVGAAKKLVSDFGGKVPGTMEELLTLPGVGRKTANLVLGDVFGTPGSVVVDTHCIRITNLLGMGHSKDPVKLEEELRTQLPPEKSNNFCHRMVLHGRAVCVARRPQCDRCCVAAWCEARQRELAEESA